MIDALKSIVNMIGLEAGNLAGSNVQGFKKKQGFIDSNSSSLGSIGNDFYTRTDFSQGAMINTPNNTDLAIQGNGFFVLFDDSSVSSFDPTKKLAELNSKNRFSTPVTNGTFTVNGNAVTVDVNNDSFNDVLNKISLATGGVITGAYDSTLNQVQLTNNSGVPGSPITFGIGPTTNFVDVAKLSKSALQDGPNNTTFLLSSNPIGVPESVRHYYYARKGNFYFNENGYLVNEKGLFVASRDPLTGNLLKTDKKTFDGKGSPDDKIHFSANGIIFNDTQLSKEGKQLALASFANPNGLVGSTWGGELFEATDSVGKITVDAPDKSQLGLIKDQNLEASNANPVESLANLGLLQRFFPSTMAALKVSFTIQDDLNNTIK